MHPSWQKAWRQGAALVLGLGLGVGLSQTLQLQNANRQTKNSPESTPDFIQTLDIKGAPALGRPDAPVTIVEFSDFECPYCRRFHQQVLIPLQRDYVDTGLVRFVHKDLPLSFHRNAHAAARVARCSQREGTYWETYRRLFERQSCLSCDGPISMASEDGATRDRLRRCIEEKGINILVNTDRSEASLHGIRATPTFVIGPTVSVDLHRGRVLEGALGWNAFRQQVDQALRRANVSIDAAISNR